MRLPDNTKQLLLFLPALGAFILLAFHSREAAAAARAGMDACLQAVAPSLFPFLVLGNLLTETGFPASALRLPGKAFERVFHIRGTALSAFLIGLLGGFPLGAVAASQAYEKGRCTREEAERLLVFSDNCSPGFLFGVAGARSLGSFGTPLCLLILQWAISIWLGILLGIGKQASYADEAAPANNSLYIPSLLVRSVSSSARSLLNICAYVVFFTVLGSCLPQVPLLRGMLELTGGILLCTGPADLPVAAFLLGWGGLSAAFQVFAAAQEAGIPIFRYLPLRLLHGGLMVLCVCCLRQGPVFLIFLLIAAGTVLIMLKNSRILHFLRV